MLQLNRRAFARFVRRRPRITPDLGSFLSGQLIDASDTVDDSQVSVYVMYMYTNIRICNFICINGAIE